MKVAQLVSLCLYLSHRGVWHSLLLLKEEIFSLDTIQRDDADGGPLRSWNRKGKMNSCHEKEKGGNGRARGHGLIRSHGKLLLLWK